ncbi:MAG: phasin family protein [Candidatus Accumulibacter sp.]|uniref:phasin family protein n=1 Tax=Accumulibacter sp. TaxID=2053492 RepID=UPI002879AE6D|nr:phasin family protein [Accumulibacter sp.]MDS4016535.1 phasin family protein [Accumulibacter sp.]
MPAAHERIIDSRGTTIDLLAGVLRTVLDGSEHLTSLNLNSARSLVEAAAVQQCSLTELRDLNDALALSRTCRRPLLEKLLSYSRSLHEIAAHVQEQLIKLAESRQAELNASLDASISPLVERMRQPPPAGFWFAQTTARCAITAADYTLRIANRSARQWAEATEACVAASACAATRAVRASA